MKPVFWAFSIYQYEQQATVRPDLPTAPYIIPKMSFIAISNFSLKGESLEGGEEENRWSRLQNLKEGII